MKAIKLQTAGGIEALEYVEVPNPIITSDEVLVKVKALSINPVDFKTRLGGGAYSAVKDEAEIILGWDISGQVTAIGSSTNKFKVGDEVFGMVNFPGHGKAYAEYVTAPAAQLALKPSNISHEEATAATLAALTAWQALVTNAKLKAGQKVLIHAAAGGVGHYAVQIAKHLGAYVIGTSSATNRDFVLSLGADEHIDYTCERFEDRVKDADLILESIGEENLIRSLEAVKEGGTVVSILGVSPAAQEIAVKKNVNCYFVIVNSNGDDMHQIAELLQAGSIKSHVSQVLPFEQMAEAHLQLETGKTKGKLVVSL